MTEPRHGEAGETIHTTGHTFDVSVLRELDEADLVQAGPACLGGRKVAGLILGDSEQDRVPLTLVHARYRERHERLCPTPGQTMDSSTESLSSRCDDLEERKKGRTVK